MSEGQQPVDFFNRVYLNMLFFSLAFSEFHSFLLCPNEMIIVFMFHRSSPTSCYHSDDTTCLAPFICLELSDSGWCGSLSSSVGCRLGGSPPPTPTWTTPSIWVGGAKTSPSTLTPPSWSTWYRHSWRTFRFKIYNNNATSKMNRGTGASQWMSRWPCIHHACGHFPLSYHCALSNKSKKKNVIIIFNMHINNLSDYAEGFKGHKLRLSTWGA